jgi:hypothetical protein
VKREYRNPKKRWNEERRYNGEGSFRGQSNLAVTSRRDVGRSATSTVKIRDAPAVLVNIHARWG